MVPGTLISPPSSLLQHAEQVSRGKPGTAGGTAVGCREVPVVPQTSCGTLSRHRPFEAVSLAHDVSC